MALDRVKTRANAEKLIRARRIPDAIRELQKLAEDNPRDIQTLNQIGNLYLQTGNKPAAVPMFVKVADLYAKTGFATKAVASLKIATREDPVNLPAWEMLASLSEQQGFTKEARLAYDQVCRLLSGGSRLDDLVRVQQKIVELEPDNIKARIQLGDNLLKLGRAEESVKEYLKSASHLIGQGMLKEAARLIERTLEVKSENLRMLEKLVKALFQRRQAAEAAEILDYLAQKHPESETLFLLKIEAMAEAQDPAGAEQACDQLLAANPRSAQGHVKKVKLLMGQGRLEEACALLDGWVAACEPADLGDADILYAEVLRISPGYLAALRGQCAVQRRSGDQVKLGEVLAKLLEAVEGHGLGEEAEALSSELAEVDPSHPLLQRRPAAVPPRKAPAPAPAPPPPRDTGSGRQTRPPEAAPSPEPSEVVDTGELEIEVDMADLDIGQPEVTSSFSAPPATGAGSAEAQASSVEEISLSAEMAQPEAVSDAVPQAMGAREAEVVREQLTEAEVFLKYGFTDKAIAELQSVLKKLPDHIHAHQKLIAILRQSGKTDKAVRQIVRLAQIFKQQGDAQTYENLLGEARKLDPGHEAIRMEVEGVQAAPSLADDLPSALRKVMAPAKSAKAKAPAVPELDLGVLVPASSTKPQDAPPPELEISLDEVELEPAAPMAEEPLVALEGPSAAGGDAGVDLSLEEEAQAPVEAAGPEISLSLSVSPEEVADNRELSEQLEEAEFYLSQELFGEARRALGLMEERWPTDPRVEVFKERFAKAAPAEAPSGPATSVREVMAPPGQAEPEVVLEEEPQAPASEPAEEEIAFVLEGEPESEVPAMEPEVAAEAPEPQIPEPAAEEPHFVLEEPSEAEEQQSAEVAESQEAPSPQDPAAALDESVDMSGDRALAELSELFDSGSEAIPSEEDEPAEGMEASAGAAPGAADRPKETRSRTKLKVSLSELVPEEILAQDQKAFEQEAPKDEFYELANELGAALDGLQIPDETLFEPEAKSPEEMSFEEVFQEFKKGVEKKVSEEDFATHYNLGIAYKEMELLDEAVGEFQLAARSPQYFVECCSMLGICFRQKGMPELAEKWYRKGIEAPGFPDEIYLGLKYDLADTLAEMGKADEAGAMFKEIYAQNAHYRDIKKRLRAYQ